MVYDDKKIEFNFKRRKRGARTLPRKALLNINASFFRLHLDYCDIMSHPISHSMHYQSEI